MDSPKEIVVRRRKEGVQMDQKTFNKMLFIYNAVQEGWTVQNKGSKYIFTKKHEGKREVFQEDFLQQFVEKGFSISGS
jgi:hypothetical protein